MGIFFLIPPLSSPPALKDEGANRSPNTSLFLRVLQLLKICTRDQWSSVVPLKQIHEKQQVFMWTSKPCMLPQVSSIHHSRQKIQIKRHLNEFMPRNYKRRWILS
jgi:hypothetical protein